MKKNTKAPDLTSRSPRSPRVRLGGYVILPRCLDKGRATLAGKNWEYHYACPLDMRWFEFAGIKPAELRKQLALGKSDGEILTWITAHSKTKPQPWEIVAWSNLQEQRGPTDKQTREYFNGLLDSLSKTRDDITSWFELLDLDDFVSYGGKA